MVVKRQCSFCAAEIEPGTGAMFVKRDGTVFHFCSGSCRKQHLHLGRVGHRFKWTRAHALKKAADRSSAQARAQPPAAAPRHRRAGVRARPSTASPVPASPAAPTPPAAAEASAPTAAPGPSDPSEAPPTAAPTVAGGAKKPAKPRTRAKKKADAPDAAAPPS